MIPAAAVLLSETAGDALASLEADTRDKSQAIARRARALRSILLADCLHGEVVRKSAIPKALRARYDLTNLYVEDLPGFWRLLHTVAKVDSRRVIIVVEIVGHKAYSQWFPGRRD